mmetsp:Transcript_47709/g.153538  ORF Transcript_47709/g.153538 Transcript_47709/m.153538 type:complete len:141 (-) Transcript_47709:210-632(-)
MVLGHRLWNWWVSRRSYREVERSRQAARRAYLDHNLYLDQDEWAVVNARPKMRAPREWIEQSFPARRGMHEGDCAICLGEIEEREVHRKLTCNHCFHAQCLDTWWRYGPTLETTCPLCRSEQRVGPGSGFFFGGPHHQIV